MTLRQSFRLEDDAGYSGKMASALEELAKVLPNVEDLAKESLALSVQASRVKDLSRATAGGLCLKILVPCEDDLDWEPLLVAGHANHPNADGETASAQTSRRALTIVSR